MRRLHGGAEPWARFHREHNGNDDIQIEPWQPEVWEAETNWTCRRKITSSKPISIPAWLCRMFGVLLLCLIVRQVGVCRFLQAGTCCTCTACLSGLTHRVCSMLDISTMS